MEILFDACLFLRILIFLVSEKNRFETVHRLHRSFDYSQVDSAYLHSEPMFTWECPVFLIPEDIVMSDLDNQIDNGGYSTPTTLSQS